MPWGSRKLLLENYMSPRILRFYPSGDLSGPGCSFISRKRIPAPKKKASSLAGWGFFIAFLPSNP